MNKLDDMINRLCPNGVEFVKLGEVCEIKTGQTINKNFIAKNFGDFPVINSGRQPLGYINTWNTENDPLGITSRGAGVGSVTWQEGKYFRGNLNYAVSVRNSILNVRLLFHLLLRMQKEIQALCTFQAIPALNASRLKNLEIPLPPLPIQLEIVRILDKFTQLEAELEAELDCRKRQYEYYRNLLLNFQNDNNNVVWKKLGEVGTFIRGNGLQKKDFTEEGVGCIHYGQIYTRLKTFTDKTLTYCSKETASKLAVVHPGDLIIACTSENVEDVCKSVAWLGNEDIVTGGHACVFRHNENPKYMAYLLQTENFFQQKKKYARGVKVIDVKAADLEKIEVPLPPLAEQARIAEVLDRFEALTTSLQEGLPAEIAARRQQYEYYRDRLLTFKAGSNNYL